MGGSSRVRVLNLTPRSPQPNPKTNNRKAETNQHLNRLAIVPLLYVNGMGFMRCFHRRNGVFSLSLHLYLASYGGLHWLFGAENFASPRRNAGLFGVRLLTGESASIR